MATEILRCYGHTKYLLEMRRFFGEGSPKQLKSGSATPILNSNCKSTAPLNVKSITHDRLCPRGNFLTVLRACHDLHGKFLEVLLTRDQPQQGQAQQQVFEQVSLETSGAFGIIRVPEQESNVRAKKKSRRYSKWQSVKVF